MEDLKFKFDLQTFADGEGEAEAEVDLEQPEADSNTEDVPDFGIDEDGNPVFFNNGRFGDGEEEGEQDPKGESAEPEGQPAEPETYVVKVNGQEQEVTLDEL